MRKCGEKKPSIPDKQYKSKKKNKKNLPEWSNRENNDYEENDEPRFVEQINEWVSVKFESKTNY